MMFWVQLPMVGANLEAYAGASDACSDTDAVAERSAEIKALYDQGEADRADRKASATSVLKRDDQRVKRMLKLDSAGELCTREDKWFAAWLLTQGNTLEPIERAYALALETMEAHHGNGPWLVAFTFDLKRTREGYHQAYGTQTRVNERNQRCLIAVEPDVTDADRTKYNVPPIEKAYRTVLDLNGFKDDAPTLENVQKRGLYCLPLATRERDREGIGLPTSEE